MQPPSVECGDDGKGAKKHDSQSATKVRVIRAEDDNDLSLIGLHCLVSDESTVPAARLAEGIAVHGKVRYLFSAALHCSPKRETPEGSDDMRHRIWLDHITIGDHLFRVKVASASTAIVIVLVSTKIWAGNGRRVKLIQQSQTYAS